MFNQIIDVYSRTKNVYGDASTTAVYEDVPCRFTERIGRVVTSEAIIKEYRAECWIEAGYSIESSYEIIYNSETYKIVGIEKVIGFDGEEDHQKLYLA